MMLETTIAHGRGWPPASSSKRTRRRRNSKVVYHANNSRCSPPRHVRPGSGYGSVSREDLPLRPAASALNVQTGGLEYFNGPPSNSGNFEYSPVLHQGSGSRSQNGLGNSNSWPHSASMVSYTLASSNGANSPTGTQFFAGNSPPSPNSGFYLLSSNELGSSWKDIASGSNVNTKLEDMSMMDIPYGSFDDSLGMSSPTTAGTSSSEGFVFPVIDAALGTSPMGNQLLDLDLSDEYFQIGQPVDPKFAVPDASSSMYDDNFVFENNELQVSMDMGFPNMYTSTDVQWSATPLIQPKQQSASPIASSVLSNMPWNPQQVQVSKFQADANAGNGTFEPPRGTPYDTYKAREEYLETGPSSQGSICQEPPSPLGDSDTESWVITSTRSNYTPSHSSPGSLGSPQSHVSSPRHHSHVFSAVSGITKPKVPKGRQGGLTSIQKIRARQVREAKACWACHISKTRCSPCSPGSPCEQCTRLVGKRRFCKFTCFNDPLESLYIFLVPVYLNGHLNRTDVEAFVARNAVSWGTKSMLVKMDWGYRKLLKAEVVALKLRENAPDMGFQDTTEQSVTSDGRQILVRRQSPPLGIPLASMDGMENEFSRYVQDIVHSDLKQYVPVAYFPEDSTLMTRLLGVVCDFYTAGSEADEECELLRRALEMHITASIMERTLNLDSESINRVQNQLQQRYPEETTAKCAQKQIKLAFYQGQQRRINRVLKDWGHMMWTIHNTANNDEKWAISFCVFLVLTLTTGKICASAYYFCEGRIQYFGANPKSERAKCHQLLKLTEKELFDRCKEIFHWKFKTRKGGKEACNPIRDGLDAFRSTPVDSAINKLTDGLQSVVREFAPEIRSQCSIKPQYRAGMGQSPYQDLGRFACIFLDDFLDH